MGNSISVREILLMPIKNSINNYNIFKISPA